jgi:hypothetical protein
MLGAFHLLGFHFDNQGYLVIITGLGFDFQCMILVFKLFYSRRGVGKTGLEPVRLAAQNPKSCASASSATSPELEDYKRKEGVRQ